MGIDYTGDAGSADVCAPGPEMVVGEPRFAGVCDRQHGGYLPDECASRPYFQTVVCYDGLDQQQQRFH